MLGEIWNVFAINIVETRRGDGKKEFSMWERRTTAKCIIQSSDFYTNLLGFKPLLTQFNDSISISVPKQLFLSLLAIPSIASSTFMTAQKSLHNIFSHHRSSWHLNFSIHKPSFSLSSHLPPTMFLLIKALLENPPAASVMRHAKLPTYMQHLITLQC